MAAAAAARAVQQASQRPLRPLWNHPHPPAPAKSANAPLSEHSPSARIRGWAATQRDAARRRPQRRVRSWGPHHYCTAAGRVTN